ncbi:RDD family protein [Campylobacter sp. 19-13652]|uniref:RDD family protein n=1 Tax=Campylobacter sp. 19-13652 TaxID=2840180 RepID=UPI001C7652D1|nr:RDD family protein [Campylobacter sp. 19-13652]BCX79131.1 hypothetical protein LBC_05930 [Campylobacter sp. 19-13652]
MNLADRLEFEGLKVASVKKRAFAFIIDEFIISVLFYIIYYDAFSVARDFLDINALLTNLVSQAILLRVIYQTFFTWYFGASLGKMAVKIEVIDANGLYKPTLVASFLRACIRAISEMCFYLGFLWVFNSPARQAWEDLVAKTVVIDVG